MVRAIPMRFRSPLPSPLLVDAIVTTIFAAGYAVFGVDTKRCVVDVEAAVVDEIGPDGLVLTHGATQVTLLPENTGWP